MQRRPEFTAPVIDLACNGIGKFAVPASAGTKRDARRVLRKHAAHRKQFAADKLRGTDAFEVLGAIFPAGTLAAVRSLRRPTAAASLVPYAGELKFNVAAIQRPLNLASAPHCTTKTAH